MEPPRACMRVYVYVPTCTVNKLILSAKKVCVCVCRGGGGGQPCCTQIKVGFLPFWPANNHAGDCGSSHSGTRVESC